MVWWECESREITCKWIILFSVPPVEGGLTFAMYRLKKSDISKPFVSNVYSVKLTLKILQCYFFLIRKEKFSRPFEEHKMMKIVNLYKIILVRRQIVK